MTTPPMEDIQKSSTLVWGVVPNIQLWNLVSSKKQVQSYEGQEEVYLTVLSTVYLTLLLTCSQWRCDEHLSKSNIISSVWVKL